MCPTPTGRLHTRTAQFVLPVLLGLLVSLVSGHGDWLAIIGVYYLLAVLLDLVVYPRAIPWQPPFVAFLLAAAELGFLLVLVGILGEVAGGFSNVQIPEAIVFFWVAWVLAALTKIVVLPIVSLTYTESAGEFRSTEWSVPVSLEALPVLAAAEEAAAGPGAIVREASGAHARPLPALPAPSGIHRVLPQENP